MPRLSIRLLLTFSLEVVDLDALLVEKLLGRILFGGLLAIGEELLDDAGCKGCGFEVLLLG